MAELQLRKEPDDDLLHSGGKVTYRVYDGDRWIGWVGDGRKWQGHRYGGQKWWACWREDGDAAARWSTGLRYATRQDAVDGLAARIAGAVEVLPEFDPRATRVARPDPDHVNDDDPWGPYARWGQATVVEPGVPIDPVPTVYSTAQTVEIGDVRLSLAEAEQLIVRIRNAIVYERGRAAHSFLIAIDADCPSCHYPERTFNPATGVFGCTKCTYTSTERNA
jgi:hypothetical protein